MRGSSIRRNILFSLAGQAILVLLSLVATHMVFRRLGAEVLGIIGFAVTVSQLLIIVSEMGISIVVTREVAAHRSTDRAYVEDLVTSVSALAWTAFVVASVVICVLAGWMVRHWLQLETTDRDAAAIAFGIICVSMLLAVPRNIYGAVVSGYERMDLWNVANVLTVGVQQLGMAILLGLGGTLIHVAAWYALTGLFGIGAYMVLVARMVGARSLLPIYRHATIRRNLGFGASLFANSLVGYLTTQADRWTIGKFLPTSVLGYYSFIQGLLGKGAIVPGAIANAAFPALSSRVATEPRAAWLGQYQKLQDLCCYVYAPVSAAIAMLGVVVTAIVFNADVATNIALPLALLSVAQYLYGALYVPYWLAMAMRRPDLSLRANVTALPVVVPATVALIYFFGLTGAALSFLTYVAWHYLYFVPRFAKVCLQRSAWQWWRRTGMFFAALLVAYGVPWWLASVIGTDQVFAGLIVAYVIGTAVFVGLGWLVVGDELRGELSKAFRQLQSVLRRKELWSDPTTRP